MWGTSDPWTTSSLWTPGPGGHWPPVRGVFTRRNAPPPTPQAPGAPDSSSHYGGKREGGSMMDVCRGGTLLFDDERASALGDDRVSPITGTYLLHLAPPRGKWWGGQVKHLLVRLALVGTKS
eukprot:GHVU01138902.1.p2 GENE.GHVU01138902.1~~GHVU01138902.1.p2  ORF type:complete len:122 (-),score=11.32 GHVU01138902.1:988-1353(-)